MRFASPADQVLANAVVDDNGKKIGKAVKAGGNPNAVDVTGSCSIFGLAVRGDGKQGNLEAVEALLDAGADPDKVSADVLSPLAVAAQQASPVMLKRLLHHGADPNIVPPGGNPATFAAAISRRWHNVITLLDNGADLETRGVRRQTLLLLLVAMNGWTHASEILAMGANPQATSDSGDTADSIALRYNPQPGDLDYHGYLLFREKLEESLRLCDGGEEDEGKVFPAPVLRRKQTSCEDSETSPQLDVSTMLCLPALPPR